MTEQSKKEKCTNCDADLIGEFCSNCGRPHTVKRINGSYILSEVGSVLNFDKGILFTMRELLLRPGQNVQKFIHSDRSRLVKPVVFLIVCSLFYTISQQLFHFEDGYVNYSFEKESTANLMFQWITTHYGYANILMAVFIAAWIKMFFRKYGYNFFEIIILLCFVMGMGMLIFSIFGFVDSLVNFTIIDKGFLLGVLYMSWAIGQFFDKKKYLNYFKALLAYMLGLMTFTIIALVIGFLIDL